MKYVYKLFFLSAMFFSSNAFAQWSSNTMQNTQVCDVTGAQELSKISLTSDGGCYISWFDTRGGSYAVYIQRLNSNGVKQFAADGLLVSNNPQSSSLVDYSLATDDSNNAIIAFTDTRNGSDINPFVYKISPSGAFLWGNNGVQLSNDFSVYQPNPKIAITPDNGVVIAWIYSISPNKIAMQRLSAGGVKQWGNDPIFITGGASENYTYANVVRSDNNSVIASWSGYTGSFINPGNYRLYTQKYSSAGAPQWGANPDTVYNLGRVSGFFVPKLISDNNNGALYVWQDDRNSVNLQSSYVQHINSAGVKLFPQNGAEGSTNPSDNKFDAWATYMTATGETYMFWKESNSLQSMFGCYGQKFSSSGSRQWTDNGKTFYPLNTNSIVTTLTLSADTSVYVYFNESIFGSANNVIKSFKCSRSGDFLWTGNIITPGSNITPKGRLGAVLNQSRMSIVSWTESRTDDNGVYAQNINTGGTFGSGVGINPNSNGIPAEFNLYQNFPNPFNPSTKIYFDIAKAGDVSIVVYDMLGRKVNVLVSGTLQPGSYEMEFKAENLPSGAYYYTMNADGVVFSEKMVLMK